MGWSTGWWEGGGGGAPEEMRIVGSRGDFFRWYVWW